MFFVTNVEVLTCGSEQDPTAARNPNPNPNPKSDEDDRELWRLLHFSDICKDKYSRKLSWIAVWGGHGSEGRIRPS